MHTIICAVHMAVDGANIGVVPLTNVNQCYRSHSLPPVVVRHEQYSTHMQQRWLCPLHLSLCSYL